MFADVPAPVGTACPTFVGVVGLRIGVQGAQVVSVLDLMSAALHAPKALGVAHLAIAWMHLPVVGLKSAVCGHLMTIHAHDPTIYAKHDQTPPLVPETRN